MVDILFEPPPQRLTRKKGSILLLHPIASGGEFQSAISGFAETVSARLYLIDRLSELPEVLPKIQGGLSLAIFSLHFLDVIEASRLLHAGTPMTEILFLAALFQEESLRAQFGPLPRIGNHWRCVDPDSTTFARTLLASYQGGDQRRTVRTTLDRFNTRLAATPAAVDPQELRKLVISDRFFASVLQQSGDAVLSVDMSRRIISFNPAAERLFRISESEALARSAMSLAAGSWGEDLTALLASEEAMSPARMNLPMEGSVRTLEVSVNPISDQTGARVALSLVIRDITERILGEDALRKAEALAATGRLAATISHEINNPLESIINLLFLLAAEPLSQAAHEYLRLANVELERVSHIVKQVLVFYRSNDRTDADSFDPREAVKHIAHLHRTTRQQVNRVNYRLRGRTAGDDSEGRFLAGDIQSPLQCH